MTTGNPGLFHKTHSLEEALESTLKSSLPRDSLLPLREALLPALQEAISSAQADGGDPRELFQAMQNVLEEWKGLMGGLQSTAANWYAFNDLQSRFSDAWWSDQLAKLAKTFQKDAQAGASNWLELFAQSLAEWDLPGCEGLTRQGYPFPDSLAFVPLMFQSGIVGLQNNKLDEVGDMLTFILDPSGFDVPPQIEPQTQAYIIILQGRITAGEDGGLDHAAALFNQASNLIPQNGLPQACLGWLNKQSGNHDQATTLLKTSVSLSPDQPEGHAGMAMLLDEQRAWEEAAAWYQRAVDCAMRHPDPFRAIERLLAPTSGNLYYYLAEALKDVSTSAALAAVERALASSLLNANLYPEVQAYELQGRLLKTHRKKLEAAHAFYEAGRRAGWNGDFGSAVTLLKQAERLDKKSQDIYLSLSENLRMHSYDLAQKPPRDKMVVESLKAWEEGARLGPFTSELSWALLTRALMNEIRPELATAPVGLADLYGWEALYYIERALLLNDKDIYSWIFLGRIYRQLNMRENYRYALDQALVINPEDNGLIEERAIMCANDGDQAQAKKLLNKLLKQENYPSVTWARSAYGFALSRQGKFAQALKYAIVPSDFNWVYFYRGLCFTRLNQLDDALNEYQVIWSKHLHENADEFGSYGQAGLFIGLIDPAQREILDQAAIFLEKSAEDKTDLFNPNFYLGCCWLLKGDDPAKAKNIMEQAIQAAVVSNDLLQMAELTVPDIIRFSAGLPNATQVNEVLQDMKRKLLARKKVIDQKRPTPEEEFADRQARLAQDDLSAMPVEVVERAKIGARAATARLDLEANHPAEAAETYAGLLSYTNQVPEAVNGLDRATEQIHHTALELLGQDDQYAYALKLLEKTFEYMKLRDKKESLPELIALIAFAYLGLVGQQEDARDMAGKYLEEAGQGYHDLGYTDIWRRVADNLRGPIQTIQQYWKIHHAMDMTLGVLKSRHLDHDDELSTGIELIQQLLDDYLAQKYGVNEPFEDIPFTYILRVELGDGIAPPENPDQWEMITKEIPDMRDRLMSEFGAAIPGVRFALDFNTLSAGGYRILIDQKTVREGQLPAGQDPTAALARIMLETFRLHIARFMDLQNAMQLIQTWQKANSEFYLTINRALPNDQTKREFGLALRDLARELVPTNQPKEILAALRGIKVDKANRPELVRAMRLALASSLPGNGSDYRAVQIPEKLETELSGYMEVIEGEVFLIIPNEAHPGILKSLKELVGSARKVALICHNPTLRPALRRLVEEKHPQLWVLSEEERGASAGKDLSAKMPTGAASHE